MNSEEKILEMLEQHSELLTTIQTDVADLKERMVRLALNLDTAEPTASPVSGKAM